MKLNKPKKKTRKRMEDEKKTVETEVSPKIIHCMFCFIVSFQVKWKKGKEMGDGGNLRRET